MKQKIKSILILSIIFIIICISFTFLLLSGHVEKNPAGTVGNTAGNLNNGGLFCEDDGKVYFANAYDGNALYSMNTDETDLKKLNKSSVKSINAAGKYLYYYQEDSAASSSFASLFRISGIYRSNKKGKNLFCLKRALIPSLALADNTIFYQYYNTKKGTSFCRIDIDKQNPAEIEDYIINPAGIDSGYIYFGGTKKDHFLYSLDIATNEITSVYAGNLYNPIVQNGYVYYMDISSDYRLCRYSLEEQTAQVLTEDRLDFFNVLGDMIYYQKNSPTEPALKRIHIDGTGEEIVAEGVYENINMTSQYVYFNEFKKPTPIYHTSTSGTINVSEFSSADTIVK